MKIFSVTTAPFRRLLTMGCGLISSSALMLVSRNQPNVSQRSQRNVRFSVLLFCCPRLVITNGTINCNLKNTCFFPLFVNGCLVASTDVDGFRHGTSLIRVLQLPAEAAGGHDILWCYSWKTTKIQFFKNWEVSEYCLGSLLAFLTYLCGFRPAL